LIVAPFPVSQGTFRRRSGFVVRCVLLVLGGLIPPRLTLAAAGWDCQPAKNGTEWVCVAGKPKPAAKPEAEAKPPASAGTATPEQPAEAQAPEPEAAPRQAETAAPPTAPPEAKPELAQPVAPAEAPVRQAEQTPAAEPEPQRPAQSPEESEAYHRQALSRPEQPLAEAESEALAKQEVPAAGGAPGWNCRPGGKEWNCSLVGPDPRGVAHSLEGGDEWGSAATITQDDELRFRSIMARLPKDPWSLACGWHKTEYTRPRDFLISADERAARDKTPLEIRSNYAEMLRNEIADFKGAADLARADQRLFGDFVSHNSEADTLTAQGNVVYQEKGLAFASDSAFLRLKNNEGVLRNTQFVLETVPSRGTSRVVHLDSKDISRYDTVTYTACPPGNQDWLMHSTSTKIDRSTGRGLAKNAWLEFKGVPVLYSPLLTFPTDDRRQSGFLNPSFASTKVGGFDLTVPYYFNLAPNFDATVTPRYLTNRGGMLRTEFRYLTDLGAGRIGAEFMPEDQRRGGSRGSFTLENRSRITENLKSAMDINYVSDKRYLNELGNVLSFPSNRHIPSWANLKYSGSNYSVEARGDYYETIDSTIFSKNRPYRRLPQVLFKFDEEIANTGLKFQTRSEMAAFDHPRDDVRVTGQRFNVRPRLYYPFVRPGGHVTPSLSFDYTQYWLQWPDAQKAGRSDSISRAAPMFSVDSGAQFEREFDWGSTPMQQTLEPRLFYLYVPKVNQSQIPIFDTGLYDFNFYQLFRENRFAGGDRLADSNQITAALTTRLIDRSSGLERLRGSIGEVFYFRDQTVNLPCDEALTANQSLTDSLYGRTRISPSVNCVGNPSLPWPPGYAATTPAAPLGGTKNHSNVVGEVSSQLNEDWLVGTTGQWNPDANRLDRGQVSLQYNNRANQLVNLSYRYRRDPITGDQVVQQTDASFRLPINGLLGLPCEGCYLSGRWQYSLLDQVTVDTFLGFEKETCCWRVSIVGSRYLNGASSSLASGSSATTNNAIFVQLELKGLTRFGDQVDRFLMRSLNGYRGPQEVFGSNPYQ